MGLFDNIFLDEDAVNTAVMEKASENKPEEISSEIPATETAKIPEATVTTDPVEQKNSQPAEKPIGTTSNGQESSSVEISEIDTGVSFDIGGDLNFGDTVSTEISNEITSETGNTATETAEMVSSPEVPVSFTVNGISYNTDGTPSKTVETTEITTTETEAEGSTASIAMIQGSTAASGINIIGSAPLEETQDTGNITEEASVDLAPINPSNEEPSTTEDDNSLINILSDSLDTATTDTLMPDTTIESTEDQVIENTTSNAQTLVESDSQSTNGKEEIILFPGDTSTPEVVAVDAQISEEMEIPPTSDSTPLPSYTKQDTPSYNGELATILDGFIHEMNNREREISNIIMKRHELTRRRTEIEEEHKTRMLALNMEDEFLRNKAERERAEQDRLQSVIKNFQKQIAKSE